MKHVLSAFRLRLDQALKDRGVSAAQVRLLHELQELAIQQHPGVSGAQLARALHVTPQSAQVQLARAVANGWVTRGRHAENGRMVTMRLTPAGTRLLEHARTVAQGIETQMWAGIRRSEVRLISGVLERALRNLES